MTWLLDGKGKAYCTFQANAGFLFENASMTFRLFESLRISNTLIKVEETVVWNYRISRTIRRTFFPEKCDLNSTCVLYAEGKYLFPNLRMSLHLLYAIFIVR